MKEPFSFQCYCLTEDRLLHTFGHLPGFCLPGSLYLWRVLLMHSGTHVRLNLFAFWITNLLLASWSCASNYLASRFYSSWQNAWLHLNVHPRASTVCKEPLFSNFISGNASPRLCTHQYGMQGSCCSLLSPRHFFSIYAYVAVWHTRKLYFRYWKYITSSPYTAVQYARKPPSISGNAPPHSTACKEDVIIYQCGHVYYSCSVMLLVWLLVCVWVSVHMYWVHSPVLLLTSFPGCPHLIPRLFWLFYHCRET